MAFVTWDDSMSVGVKEIDDQHKILMSLINEFHDWTEQKKEQEVLDSVFEELINYTKYHFSAEERRMKQFSYIGYLEHKREHDELTGTVMSLKAKHDKGDAKVSSEVSALLKDWLTKHIQGTDKKYTPFFNSQGLV